MYSIIESIKSFFLNYRNLQTDPFIMNDGLVKDSFFVVTPFWEDFFFKTSTARIDFDARSSIGFIRSNPNYRNTVS